MECGFSTENVIIVSAEPLGGVPESLPVEELKSSPEGLPARDNDLPCEVIKLKLPASPTAQ